jgi:bifunctional UDP-N-acetylglucosamine pyrophosphorylase/glucosamine-1-phosphate N-acetyltransferase
MRDFQAVVLAAGKSTRMGNGNSKLIYKINGKSIIKYVVEACEIPEISKINVLVGFDSDKIKDELGSNYNYFYQSNQLGTGHAVMKFKEFNRSYQGDLLILVGDTPYINGRIIKEFISYYQEKKVDALFTTAKYDSFIPPFARVIRNGNGEIINILEDFECNTETKIIDEVITSQYCFKSEILFPGLEKIKPKGANGEYCLNDIIKIFLNDGVRISNFNVKNPKLVYGINSIDDLEYSEIMK